MCNLKNVAIVMLAIHDFSNMIGANYAHKVPTMIKSCRNSLGALQSSTISNDEINQTYTNQRD